jgi:hypothetical protein
MFNKITKSNPATDIHWQIALIHWGRGTCNTMTTGRVYETEEEARTVAEGIMQATRFCDAIVIATDEPVTV